MQEVAEGELPHYVRLGGKVEDNQITQEFWVTQPHPKGTDLNAVRWRSVRAIVDTGCTHTAIRMDVAAELGLPIVDQCVVATASSGVAGETRPMVLGLVLVFENPMREAIAERKFIAQDMADEMLLGMDLLDGGILRVDLVNKTWEWKLHQRVAHSPNPYR